MFTNFEYITFFSCPTKRNIFYKRLISIKPLWLEIIEKKGCTKSVRVICIYNIYNSDWADWLWALYFLNCFESELFYRDGPFIKNVCFVETQKMLHIQNWWTVPLKTLFSFEFFCTFDAVLNGLSSLTFEDGSNIRTFFLSHFHQSVLIPLSSYRYLQFCFTFT